VAPKVRLAEVRAVATTPVLDATRFILSALAFAALLTSTVMVAGT
jgi:hypothetical protein